MSDKEMMEIMFKTLFGNGQEGLTTKVGKLQTLTKVILTISVMILVTVIGAIVKGAL